MTTDAVEKSCAPSAQQETGSRFKPIHISLLLFIAALVCPVDKGTEFLSQSGENVFTFGWSYFFMSFVGLITIVEAYQNLEPFLLALSGALTNLLLILGWLRFSAWKYKSILLWTSGTALLLSLVPLTKDLLLIGYWLWVSSAAAQFITVLKTRRQAKLSGKVVLPPGIEPGSTV